LFHQLLKTPNPFQNSPFAIHSSHFSNWDGAISAPALIKLLYPGGVAEISAAKKGEGVGI